MQQSEYVYKYQKKLRCGYTTGTCAAAAAGAACQMLLLGGSCETYEITVPKGTKLILEIEDILQETESVKCAVRKDAGDDQDATDGILVYARVEKTSKQGVYIHGGSGVGRVTKPGLNQPVGEAAINDGPRQMIRSEVEKQIEDSDYKGGISVTIEIPKGEEIALKTFNPRLGIEGGISILGTTGIVEPMSEQALVDTIQTEIRMRKAQDEKKLLMIPGNYGLEFVKNWGILSYEKAVICSNFIGETIDFAVSEGFQRILLIGHIGKLVKIGSGIMNTHSHVADARMETLAACACEANVSLTVVQKVLKANTTEEALDILIKQNVLDTVMKKLESRIEKQLSFRAGSNVQIGCVFFSSAHGILGMTSLAEQLMKE